MAALAASGDNATKPISALTPVSSRDYIAQTVLPLNELPPHEALQNLSSTIKTQSFTQTILDQGLQFMNNTLPKFHVKNTSTSSKPSTAQVELLSHERGKEAWFARRSKHENVSKSGTASWDEFDRGTRIEHSERERDYTPDVVDAHYVCEWPVSDQEVTGWKEVEVKVYEMLHKLPMPLQPRLFSVLVVSARSTTITESIVVQIPIDLTPAPKAKYANGTSTTKTVLGEYVSLERLKLEGEHVVWEMATASDAKGNLPMGIQKLGTPGAVVKDVGLLIDWIEKQRAKR